MTRGTLKPRRRTNVAEPELVPMQRWMQHAIVHAHEGKPARGRAETWILPSKTLAPAERVDIYAGMYRLRMIEALETDYPALERALGHEGFHALVMDYVRAHPSRHYSLNFLGDRLPAFLASPRANGLGKDRAFLADVARVEHTITVVFDLPEATKLDPGALAKLPPEAWANARLRPSGTLRLLALDHAANAAVTALRHGKTIASKRKQSTWIAVYRKDWVVWRMDLERAAHAILLALTKGKPLAHAIVAGAKVWDGDPAELQTKIRGWFAEWSAEGFFGALELPPPRRRAKRARSARTAPGRKR